MEDERAVTPLIEIIDDPDIDVRLAVIEALGHIGGEDVVRLDRLPELPCQRFIRVNG